jgi:hypothetical protein
MQYPTGWGKSADSTFTASWRAAEDAGPGSRLFKTTWAASLDARRHGVASAHFM